MNSVVFNYKGLVINELKKLDLPYCDLEELTQDALIKAWKNYDKFDEAKGKLSTWIRTISRNVGYDFLRKKRLIFTEISKIDIIKDCGNRLFNEEKEVVNEVLSHLNKRDQMILEAYYLLGYKHKEIAEMLELPTNRIGQEIKRAAKRFELTANKLGFNRSELW